MLTIRKEQIDALSQHRLHQFFYRMEEHLTERFPEQTAKALESEQLRDLIVQGVAKYNEY